MIRGCFTNFFAAIGCLTVMALGAVGAWYFRDDIAEIYRTVVERDGATGNDLRVVNAKMDKILNLAEEMGLAEMIDSEMEIFHI